MAHSRVFKSIAAVMLLVLLTDGMAGTAFADTVKEEQPAAKETAATTASTTIYRMYNRNTSEHLYTSDLNEVKTLYAMAIGWGYEGTCWQSPSTGTPVYRVFHAGLNAHVYTTDTNEVNVLTSKYDWVKDNGGKPVFYSAPKSSTAIPVYRLYNPGLHGLHHQTTDVNEYNVLPKYGWKQEGVSFYANAVGAPLKQTRFHPAVMDGDGPAEGYGWWTNSQGQTQFYENGQIVKGRFVVTKPNDPRAGLARYWFDNNGVLVQNRFIPASECGWNCFATTNGAIAIHKTKWGSGMLIADAKGELYTKEGWLVSSAYDGDMQRYWFDKSCNGMVGGHLGFFEVGGKLYYGTDQGYVLRNASIQKDGTAYYADNDGVLSPFQATVGSLSNLVASASGSANLTSFGAAYNMNSAAGQRVSNIVNRIRSTGRDVGFVMIDLTTGVGASCNANKSIFVASSIKGAYVAAINKFNPGAVTPNVRNMMAPTIQVSSNNDYAMLRMQFGSLPMAQLQDFVGEHGFSNSEHYPFMTPKQLARLWVGIYDYFYVHTNGNSAWCRSLYTNTKLSFIHPGIGGKYTVHTKPGWTDTTPNTTSRNDAGIVMAGNRPYVLAIMSTAYGQDATLAELASALDALHSEMVK